MKLTVKIVRTVLVITLLLTNKGNLKAQIVSTEKPTPHTHMAIGFNLSDVQGSFGYGLNVTSPYFLNNSVAVRASANFHWLQHLKPSLAETTWTPFTAYKLGLAGGMGMLNNAMRFYGEGGVMLIVPNKDFSSKTSVMGGYGVFGFEFFVTEHLNYFLELGGSGSGATADKVAGKPIYFNGFLSNVGLRVSL